MNEFKEIFSRASKEGLPFLVVGGYAVIAHGRARTTADIDLLIRRDDRARWLSLVANLGYSVFREGPTFLQFNPTAEGWAPLDLMLVNQETFGKMMADSVPGPAAMQAAKVVSLLHLLALKSHAIKYGDADRIGKDLDDVLGLVRANSINVNDSEIRALFLKYGTQELYERVRGSTAGSGRGSGIA